MSDNVNHPAHYEKSTSLECIEVIRLILGDKGTACFCIGNAFKYAWRYKNKNGIEDLDKAKWYLDYINENLLYCTNTYESNICDELAHLLCEKRKEMTD